MNRSERKISPKKPEPSPVKVSESSTSSKLTPKKASPAKMTTPAKQSSADGAKKVSPEKPDDVRFYFIILPLP